MPAYGNWPMKIELFFGNFLKNILDQEPEEPFCAMQQYPNYDKTSQSAKFLYSNQHHVDNQIPDRQKDLESRVDFSHNVKPPYFG